MSDINPIDASDAPVESSDTSEAAVEAPTTDVTETYALDASAEPEPEAPVAAVVEDAARATPSDLEGDIKTVLDGLVTGAIALPEGKKATPHVLAGLIQTLRGGDKSDRPSSGAVAAALTRWVNIGFITLTSNPDAFEDYTSAGIVEGLSALKAANRARLAAARAAEKAAAAPAPAPAAEPEVVTPVDLASPF